MRDLIFISMENWDEVWRRNQFVCAELARRHPSARILFVGLPRDASNAIRRRRLEEFCGGTAAPSDIANISVTRPLKLLPNSIALGQAVNRTLFLHHVRGAAARLGMKRPLLWINPQWAAHLRGRLGESGVIYDVTDDWTALAQPRKTLDLTRRQDAKLCRDADAVIVCSQRLLELKRGLVKNPERLHLIPNGVDAEHYRGVVDGVTPPAPEAAAWSRPVLGYLGTIHPERLDVELTADIARCLRDRGGGSVALVGPNHLQPADRQRLTAPNIHFVEAIPYSRAPNMLAAFDVCITPHKTSAFTESLNPIKLWEYLAAGKPIVSTDVAGFRDYPPFVRIARSGQQFVEAALGGLAEDRRVWRARHAEAAKSLWRRRVDQVEAVLGDVQNRCGHS